jgi:hypothetical protein
MAIDNITPVASSVLLSGSSISFKVDDSYAALKIEVYVDGPAWEDAYDTASGGAQAGYTITVEDDGSRHTFTMTRDLGWNLEPQLIKITEDEDDPGVTDTETNISYYLGTQARYPQDSEPLNPLYVGTLIITEDNVQVRDDVGWLDFDDASFNVTDMGSGKVHIAAVGGSGSGDLVGPASATDDALVVFDGTTGKLVKNSTGTIAQVSANTAKKTAVAHALGTWTKGDDTIGSTSADQFDVDNATIVAITAIRILVSNPLTGAPIDGWIHSVAQTGTLVFQDVSDPGVNCFTFNVSSHASAGAGIYWDVAGTVEEDFGTNWATSYSVQFIPDAGSGTGDVVGPGSATDDAIVVYDGTTGKLIKDSTGTIAQIVANTAKVTNATHSGDVAGATTLTIGAKKVTLAMMEDGTDGELITYDASGVAAKVAVGAAGEVLTSNGVGAAPTMQAAAGGVDTTAIHKATAGEIAAMSLVTVAAGDHIVIEDASDSNNKKRIAASDLIGGGGGGTSVISIPVTFEVKPIDGSFAGPEKEAGWIGTDLTEGAGYGTSSVPVVDNITAGLVIPVGCDLVSYNLWFRSGSSSNDVNVGIYKWTRTHDSTTVSACTLVGTKDTTTLAGGLSISKSYKIGETGLTETLAADDHLGIFFEGNAGTATGSIFVTGVLYFEVA